MIPSTDWKALHGDHFAGQRVVVTGGAGFIGSHLARALLELGARVVVIDDLSGGSASNLPPQIEQRQGSILDASLLAETMAGAWRVFHLAALGSVPRSVEEPGLFCEVNIVGTLRVLEAARAANVGRILFAASSSAYGTNPVPWIETMATMAQSPYAATKSAGESLLAAYSASYGLDSASLRYFNIFGPRQNANSAYAAVIAAFAKAMLRGESPVIYGDGTQSRDFTFVDNAVHANLLAARKMQPLAGVVINVGCGKPITINALASQMAQQLGMDDAKQIHRPLRAGDLMHSHADLSRARAILNYQPIVDFGDGLTRTLEWYRDAFTPLSAS